MQGQAPGPPDPGTSSLQPAMLLLHLALGVSGSLKSLSQLMHFKKVKSNSLWEESAGKDKQEGAEEWGGWDEGI